MPTTPPPHNKAKPGSPIAPREENHIKARHAEGATARQIGIELGRPHCTVARVARRLGLHFNGDRTAQATKVAQISARHKRANLENRYLDLANTALDELTQPATVYNFGGKDNTYAEHQLDQPTYADKLKITQRSTIMVDRAIRIAILDGAADPEEATSLLQAIANSR